MTEFAGLDEGMFEFFVQSERDPDTKKWYPFTGTVPIFLAGGHKNGTVPFG
jgi:hypothetical protein